MTMDRSSESALASLALAVGSCFLLLCPLGRLWLNEGVVAIFNTPRNRRDVDEDRRCRLDVDDDDDPVM